MTTKLSVELRGPMFTKDISKAVEDAIASSAIAKIEERMERSARSGGKKALGRRRNTITQHGTALTLTIDSTTNWPRTTGRKWEQKNVGIIRAMTKNVLKKASRQITEELS